jgi:UDP-N-acetylglucosamine--N-acetylmuramyl-(pentapeptide) pyrophosphoryl-undecaprenol N-acetylglucosamine transferase
MARAALAGGIPLILLEQNAFPGRATRRLAPHAKLVCVAFEEARRHLRAAGPIRVTGNPVRVGPKTQRKTAGGARRLLVLGGSQGSESLNLAVPQALARLQPELAGWSIVHQAGEAGAAAAVQLYQELGLAAHVVPFIENLPRVMAHCDLAISRAGGTVLAELAAAALPAVVVPYPAASDDHQLRNAEACAASGACRLIDGRHGASSVEGQLVSELPELLLDGECRQAMAAAIARLARPAAAWHVASMILDQALGARPLRVAA